MLGYQKGSLRQKRQVSLLSMVESISLKQFGYNFCGPVVYRYIKEVSEFLDTNPKKVFCLAREGYLFKQAIEAYMPGIEATYLLASRTFLFRILIADPTSWQFSLGHAFEGKLESFFVSRFGFSQEQVKLFLKDNEPDRDISLPSDREVVESILQRELNVVSKIVAGSRDNYLRYLTDNGLTQDTLEDALLLDVGYSGTIQKLLSILLNSNSHGYYFITTDSDNTSVNGLTSKQYYVFKDKVKMGEGYIMLDRSMFLESLFTSPDGQFIDILESANGDFIPCYGKRNYTQHNFVKLNLVFEGILEAIRHFKEQNINFSVEEIESLYSLYVSSRHLLPSAAWPLFEFDDAISGYGNVNSLQFFGM